MIYTSLCAISVEQVLGNIIMKNNLFFLVPNDQLWRTGRLLYREVDATAEKCSLCDHNTGSNYCFHSHVRLVGKSPSLNAYRCTICQHQTKHKSNMVSHVRTHTGHKPFQCLYCPFRARLGHQIVLHTSVTHHGMCLCVGLQLS